MTSKKISVFNFIGLKAQENGQAYKALLGKAQYIVLLFLTTNVIAHFG